MHVAANDSLAPIEIMGVGKRFGSGTSATIALDDVSLSVGRGEILLLMGPSGSGKTTLLSIMGCILRPDSGVVRIAGQDVTKAGQDALSLVRLRHIGFIFQEYHLFPTLTVLQNVLVSLDLKGIKGVAARKAATAGLSAVGLGDRLNEYPAKLSGGQKQRLAIARALAGEPGIILADEPTAALDSETGRSVLNLLRGLAHDLQRTLVIVTHDPRIIEYADRVVRIEDGRILPAGSDPAGSTCPTPAQETAP
ncbi:ABC transporter related protein [Alkalidesulfovibrio alkalitolerans DSM 16529]|jgi:putative ABC transport system ATP-binding protein|uniref:ABC transporter related protein n=1 Tax=Alkalidesulfovibrio alkalitolerans DSM 16529 TaxID=1121439 RepID=S7T1U4_9BACT|nr:ABC transporter ATP-binding protein [Alkalidesulfovibrio alkalitolerans]EPR30546.1 ABC transporter related protein [Alkalidesulfovibrio alkalitolerans DSM 16529]